MDVKYIDYKNDDLIAYFPNTKRFFRVNENGKDVIDDILNGMNSNEIKSKYSLTDELAKKYFEDFSNLNSTKIINESELNEVPEDYLHRLVIHLSNDCNLRCKYCYANGGNYCSDKGLLRQEVLDKTIDFFFKKFKVIETIQFFGGEPLMNVSMLKYACEKLYTISKERNYDIHFGLVTNGTIINQEIIDLIKKYNITITVSYDGDKVVNDIMRVDRNGAGTSELIIDNVKKLIDVTGQPTTIEVTYNKYHVENNISISDVCTHIRENFGDIAIHLVPAAGIPGSGFVLNNREPFLKNVDDYFDMKDVRKTTYSLIERLLVGLLDDEKPAIPVICDAGIGTISVSINGDIYPCFMFTDKEDMKIGNVFEIKENFDFKNTNIIKKISEFSIKAKNKDCKDCFINSICNGCLGLNSYGSGNPFELDKMSCDMFRSMTEKILYYLVAEAESSENSEE